VNGDEVLSVLRQIRDEAKQTNARLESLDGRVETTNARLESLEGRVETTNARLESLEGRIEFLEHRVSSGFAELEMRLATEIVGLAKVTRELRDVVRGKFAA
jgi:peptidoglycan hydrolase CwlO-like protein